MPSTAKAEHSTIMESQNLLEFHCQGRQVIINACMSHEYGPHCADNSGSTDSEVIALFEARVTKTALVEGEGLALFVGLENGNIYFLRANIHEKASTKLATGGEPMTEEGIDMKAHKTPESTWDLTEVVEELRLSAKNEHFSTKVVAIEDCYRLYSYEDAKEVTYLSCFVFGDTPSTLATFSSSASGHSVVSMVLSDSIVCANDKKSVMHEYVKDVSNAHSSPFPGPTCHIPVVVGSTIAGGMFRELGLITALAVVPHYENVASRNAVLIAGTDDGRVYGLNVPTHVPLSAAGAPSQVVAQVLIGGTDGLRGPITSLDVTNISSLPSSSLDNPVRIVRVHLVVEAQSSWHRIDGERLRMDCSTTLLEGGKVKLLLLSSPAPVSGPPSSFLKALLLPQTQRRQQ